MCPADLDVVVEAWRWRRDRELDLVYAGAWAAEIAARTTELERSAQAFIERLTGAEAPKARLTPAEVLAKVKWLHYLLGGR